MVVVPLLLVTINLHFPQQFQVWGKQLCQFILFFDKTLYFLDLVSDCHGRVYSHLLTVSSASIVFELVGVVRWFI